MKLENQVVSLELAKQLNELGVEQESLSYWLVDNRAEPVSMPIYYGYDKKRLDRYLRDEDYEVYSAFTVAELGEMLKEYAIDYWYSYPDFRLKLQELTDTQGRDEKEADARAEMLIYLIENGLAGLTMTIRDKTDKHDWEKEFDDLWEHWIYLSGVKQQVNFNAFRDGIKSVVGHILQSHLRESLGRVKSRFDFVPLPDDGTSSKEKIIIAQTNMLIGFFHQAIDTELKGLGGKE